MQTPFAYHPGTQVRCFYAGAHAWVGGARGGGWSGSLDPRVRRSLAAGDRWAPGLLPSPLSRLLEASAPLAALMMTWRSPAGPTRRCPRDPSKRGPRAAEPMDVTSSLSTTWAGQLPGAGNPHSAPGHRGPAPQRSLGTTPMSTLTWVPPGTALCSATPAKSVRRKVLSPLISLCE